jgi:hypothetical protein
MPSDTSHPFDPAVKNRCQFRDLNAAEKVVDALEKCLWLGELRASDPLICNVDGEGRDIWAVTWMRHTQKVILSEKPFGHF